MLKTENLSVTKNSRKILKDINLEIRSGEKVMIRGESGSGKTTLIKSLLFFEYFSGSIYYKGERVIQQNLEEYRHDIGFISQRMPNFNEKVGKFLQLPYLYSSNHNRVYDPNRAKELMERLSLPETIEEREFSVLSGGEKQRLLILQQLLLNKPVYILDEITASLDKQNIRKVIDLFTSSTDQTVITVSHNHEWEKKVDRILIMDQGMISRSGEDR